MFEPGKQIVTLTDAAATQVRALNDAADNDIIGLRIGIKTAGCSGKNNLFHIYLLSCAGSDITVLLFRYDHQQPSPSQISSALFLMPDKEPYRQHRLRQQMTLTTHSQHSLNAAYLC